MTDKVLKPAVKLGDLQVGDSVTGILTGTTTSKFDKPILFMTIAGVESVVFTKGNVARFLPGDIESGKIQLNTEITITRTEDKSFVAKNGPKAGETIKSSNFNYLPPREGQTASPAVQAPKAPVNDAARAAVKAAIEASKAKASAK